MTRGVRRLDGLVRALLEQHLVSGDCGLEVQESYDFEIIVGNRSHMAQVDLKRITQDLLMIPLKKNTLSSS